MINSHEKRYDFIWISCQMWGKILKTRNFLWIIPLKSILLLKKTYQTSLMKKLSFFHSLALLRKNLSKVHHSPSLPLIKEPYPLPSKLIYQIITQLNYHYHDIVPICYRHTCIKIHSAVFAFIYCHCIVIIEFVFVCSLTIIEIFQKLWKFILLLKLRSNSLILEKNQGWCEILKWL